MREILLLIEKSSHCLSYYDTQSGDRLHTVPLPDFPHEFVLCSDKSTAYIGHYGVINSGSTERGGHSVLILDIATGTITQTLDLGHENNRPHGVGIDGSDRLYVLSEGSAKLLVWDNLKAGGSHDREASTGGQKSHLFAVSKDGRKAYSMNLDSNDVTLFDPFDKVSAPIKIGTGEKPEGRLLRNDEKVLYITTRISETLAAIDTETLKIIAEVPCPGDPVRVFHDTRRGRLMTINYGANYVGVFEDATLAPLGRIDVSHPPIAISFDAAFDRAFLSIDDNKLHFVDLDTLDIQRTLETCEEPDVSAVITLPEDASVLTNQTEG